MERAGNLSDSNGARRHIWDVSGFYIHELSVPRQPCNKRNISPSISLFFSSRGCIEKKTIFGLMIIYLFVNKAHPELSHKFDLYLSDIQLLTYFLQFRLIIQRINSSYIPSSDV